MPTSPPDRRPVFTTTGAAIGLLSLSAALFGALADPAPVSAAQATAPTRPDTGAVMVGWHEKGDDLDALRAHEAQLGTRFAVVRIYQQWRTPSSKVETLVAEGRLVLVSHKPPADGWAAVASGAEDAAIAQLADRYRAYGREVIFTFHHEPHDDATDIKGGSAGAAADYLAAWRRIHGIFVARGAHRSAGGNVSFGYSATGSWALAAAPGGPAGSGDPLYPGGDIIDVLAHDRYNWATCRGDDWEEFEENWAPLVALAARLGKPLIAGELGAAPAGGGRNDWFRRGAEWMRTDPLARRWMWGFAYYHSLHDTCPWDFLNQGDDGALGWREAFSHPYFTGTPFSLGSPGGSTALAASPFVETSTTRPSFPAPTAVPRDRTPPPTGPPATAPVEVAALAPVTSTGEHAPAAAGPGSAPGSTHPAVMAEPADRRASVPFSETSGARRPLPPVPLPWIAALVLAVGLRLALTVRS